MKCLVTGATGFIGRQLCRRLAAGGNTVVALSKSGGLLDSGESTTIVDLAVQDPDSDLLRGVEVIFHLAGIAHQRAEAAAYDQLNYRATLRLARLASANGVRTFIFLSSVKAMGSPVSSQARSESCGSTPEDAYGRSKRQAELALQEEFSDGGMSVGIVRPALVYGDGVKGNLHSLAAGVRWGLPRPPCGGSRSMVDVEDLVDLLCIVAQRRTGGVCTWIACGDHDYSTRAIYDLLRAATGKAKGVGWLPHSAWRATADLLDWLAGRRRGATYDKLFGSERYSNAAVLADTNWRPSRRLEESISRFAGNRSERG